MLLFPYGWPSLAPMLTVITFLERIGDGSRDRLFRGLQARKIGRVATLIALHDLIAAFLALSVFFFPKPHGGVDVTGLYLTSPLLVHFPSAGPSLGSACMSGCTLQ